MSEYETDEPMTAERAGAWRARLRRADDGLDQGFARPAEVEPLASRLERAQRVADCRNMTYEMLADWHAQGAPIGVQSGIWVKGIFVDFLVLTWKGVFLVWPVDQRWTIKQAALVQPARAQIQEEMEGWPGQVEVVFHSPREATGWERQVLMRPESEDPVEIVLMRGRIEQVLDDWQPVGGVGLDPEWITSLDRAAEPRWWRSDEGRLQAPELPPEEQL